MYHAMSRMLRSMFKRASDPQVVGTVHAAIEEAMQADLMLQTPSWVLNTPARLG